MLDGIVALNKIFPPLLWVEYFLLSILGLFVLGIVMCVIGEQPPIPGLDFKNVIANVFFSFLATGFIGILGLILITSPSLLFYVFGWPLSASLLYGTITGFILSVIIVLIIESRTPQTVLAGKYIGVATDEEVEAITFKWIAEELKKPADRGWGPSWLYAENDGFSVSWSYAKSEQDDPSRLTNEFEYYIKEKKLYIKKPCSDMTKLETVLLLENVQPEYLEAVAKMASDRISFLIQLGAREVDPAISAGIKADSAA